MQSFRKAALCLLAALSLTTLTTWARAAEKPKPISLDEYLNATSIRALRISPDGTAAVIEVESADWKANSYRTDLYLWSASAGLRPLTHSGSEADVEWSPDGKWIAFLSDREPTLTDPEAPSAPDAEKVTRIWLIPASGGEALPLFSESLDVHAFAWSPDSSAIYYSVTTPLTAEEQETQKEEWKDVIRWREQHRGDLLLKQPVAASLALALANPPAHEESGEKKEKKSKKKAAEDAPTLPKLAVVITTSPLEIASLDPSPDGHTLAFTTEPPHHRVENIADYEIYLTAAEPKSPARQLTKNEGAEIKIRWSRDGKLIYFMTQGDSGFVEGKYQDLQPRLYRISAETGKIERLGASFTGAFEDYVLLSDGREIALGLKGLERQLYLIEGDAATKLAGTAGSYSELSAALNTPALLFAHSTLNEPTQAFLAADPSKPTEATKLTSFNPIFAERAQPEWRAINWTSPDGKPMEGVLIFPPGKLNAKHLRMLTLIHGGPADADGDHFGADWYDWATYAAAHGWLVFRPNYRGSTGYGDETMLSISPHLVSAPGLDILSGVDEIVKQGFADPERLAVGGYSYGGYMTNWLITQTDRFKAAVTGAGAVEHAANWGNDDLSYDDSWYVGGAPWENPAVYQSEAALFQFNKVKTPVHLVQGSADVRVSYLEGELMERALEKLKIPHTFLVLPGEGHSLAKNPWHGYIKLREEMKWLEQYVPEK